MESTHSSEDEEEETEKRGELAQEKRRVGTKRVTRSSRASKAPGETAVPAAAVKEIKSRRNAKKMATKKNSSAKKPVKRLKK